MAKTFRALVVEDHPDWNTMYCDAVGMYCKKAEAKEEISGFEIVSVDNVEDGITHIDKGNFDVIITDNDTRTSQTGLDLINHLRTYQSQNPESRVIMISASSLEKEATALGSDQYVDKAQFDSFELVDDIAALLAKDYERVERKCGMLLVGKNNAGETALVSSWAQGRYADNALMAPTVPKGDFESGKFMQDAAAELKEETGIELDTLKAGGYSGVKLQHSAVQKLPEMTYLAASGKLATLELGVGVVENIEGLSTHLKSADLIDEDGNLKTTATEQAQQANAPQFDDLLKSLHAKKQCLEISEDDPQRGQIFWKEYATNEENKKTIKGELAAFRDQLAADGHVNDMEGLKWDDKVSVVHWDGQSENVNMAYFNEGAVIKTPDEIRKAAADYVAADPDYPGVRLYQQSTAGREGADYPGQLEQVLQAIESIDLTRLQTQHQGHSGELGRFAS